MASEGERLKEEALDLLEEKRHAWIADARKYVIQLIKIRRSYGDKPPIVTSDDVWIGCPPPDDINPKVMGAVFRVKYGFKPLGYVQSKRKKAHHRPIREWTFG